MNFKRYILPQREQSFCNGRKVVKSSQLLFLMPHDCIVWYINLLSHAKNSRGSRGKICTVAVLTANCNCKLPIKSLQLSLQQQL